MKTYPAGVTRYRDKDKWVYVVRREPETVYEFSDYMNTNLCQCPSCGRPYYQGFTVNALSNSNPYSLGSLGNLFGGCLGGPWQSEGTGFN
jgi:hypothetical protein